MNARADRFKTASPTNSSTNRTSKPTRCAIYTRKSTSEGLNADFNTLDAQREAAEHYILAMKREGWEALPAHYDDGGFTGANTERPALKRLIADIEAGAIDCVVVYKVDRLSRSLTDFAELLALFDRNEVTFVSTTQNFNTTSSMGRLTLNILLSFAQFEREMIAERTRDKMGAARKRGKWLGSKPVLGYDGDRERKLLVINEAEAEQVRSIFALYLRLGSIDNVAQRLNELGWERKRHVAKTGRVTGEGPWRSKDVHYLLRNPIYIGKVTYKGERYDGEHEAIISEELFQQVHVELSSKACGRGKRRPRNPAYLIQGITYCGRCGERLTTTAGKGRGGEVYRYYLCSSLREKGRAGCDQPRLSAPEVEELILARVKARCADPALKDELMAHIALGPSTAAKDLESQRALIRAEEADLHAEGRQLMTLVEDEPQATVSRLITDRLTEIERRLDALNTQRSSLDAQLEALESTLSQLRETVELTEVFDQVWSELPLPERQALVHLVIQRITIDEPAGLIDIELHELTDPPPPEEYES